MLTHIHKRFIQRAKISCVCVCAYVNIYMCVFMEKDKIWLVRKVLMFPYFQNMLYARILAMDSGSLGNIFRSAKLFLESDI